jgi:hypothetical protein
MNKSTLPNVLISLKIMIGTYRKSSWRGMIAIVICSVFVGPSLLAQENDLSPEAYRLKLEGAFWYATPTASVSGSSTEVPVSFDRTLGFQNYSTFKAGLDWHFKRKHHLLFLISPNQTTRTAVLHETITFKNQTFLAGSSVTGQLKNYSFAPAYRYDIIHRPGGHLGVIVQINLIDFKASITANVLQPGQANVTTASGTLFTPLPVGGPDGRIYFARNRLYIDGNIKGMYFFGYGNFISTGAKVGVCLTRHIDAVGGYELGSHLAIHGTSNRLDIRQTQRGPTAGLAFTF